MLLIIKWILISDITIERKYVSLNNLNRVLEWAQDKDGLHTKEKVKKQINKDGG